MPELQDLSLEELRIRLEKQRRVLDARPQPGQKIDDINKRLVNALYELGQIQLELTDRAMALVLLLAAA